MCHQTKLFNRNATFQNSFRRTASLSVLTTISLPLPLPPMMLFTVEQNKKYEHMKAWKTENYLGTTPQFPSDTNSVFFLLRDSSS